MANSADIDNEYFSQCRCSFPQMFVANTDALEEFFESAYYSVNAKKKKVPEILQYRQIYKPNV